MTIVEDKERPPTESAKGLRYCDGSGGKDVKVAWETIARHQISSLKSGGLKLRITLKDSKSFTFIMKDREDLSSVKRDITKGLIAYQESQEMAPLTKLEPANLAVDPTATHLDASFTSKTLDESAASHTATREESRELRDMAQKMDEQDPKTRKIRPSKTRPGVVSSNSKANKAVASPKMRHSFPNQKFQKDPLFADESGRAIAVPVPQRHSVREGVNNRYDSVRGQPGAFLDPRPPIGAEPLPGRMDEQASSLEETPVSPLSPIVPTDAYLVEARVVPDDDKDEEAANASTKNDSQDEKVKWLDSLASRKFILGSICCCILLIIIIVVVAVVATGNKTSGEEFDDTPEPPPTILDRGTVATISPTSGLPALDVPCYLESSELYEEPELANYTENMGSEDWWTFEQIGDDSVVMRADMPLQIAAEFEGVCERAGGKPFIFDDARLSCKVVVPGVSAFDLTMELGHFVECIGLGCDTTDDEAIEQAFLVYLIGAFLSDDQTLDCGI